MRKSKIFEALLVISTAFMVLYLFGIVVHGESREIFLYLACGVGISGILVRPLGKIIALGWYKMADLLSFVMSRLILAAVFLVVLVPVSTLYKIRKKDRLALGRSSKSKWITREHQYSAADLKNLW